VSWAFQPLLPAGAQTQAVSGYIKVWNGIGWYPAPVKYWNGSSWVAYPMKFWNGSAWVLTPTQ